MRVWHVVLIKLTTCLRSDQNGNMAALRSRGENRPPALPSLVTTKRREKEHKKKNVPALQ